MSSVGTNHKQKEEQQLQQQLAATSSFGSTNIRNLPLDTTPSNVQPSSPVNTPTTILPPQIQVGGSQPRPRSQQGSVSDASRSDDASYSGLRGTPSATPLSMLHQLEAGDATNYVNMASTTQHPLTDGEGYARHEPPQDPTGRTFANNTTTTTQAEAYQQLHDTIDQMVEIDESGRNGGRLWRMANEHVKNLTERIAKKGGKVEGAVAGSTYDAPSLSQPSASSLSASSLPRSTNAAFTTFTKPSASVSDLPRAVTPPPPPQQEEQQSSTNQTSSRMQIADAFLLKTQSRADPESMQFGVGSANVNSKDPVTPYQHHPVPNTSPGNSPRKDDDSDEDHRTALRSTAVAHKRVRVVQLLIIGLIGLFVVWLGSFWVGYSCHFLSMEVPVGNGSGSTFDFHVGLWKYSPTDSALSGYQYCYPYSDDMDAPMVARSLHVAALATGTFSLFVLWFYLIVGKTTWFFWQAAVSTARAAALFQVLTLVAFLYYEELCQSHECFSGPAGGWTILTAVAWLVFSFELAYNNVLAESDPTTTETATVGEEHSQSIQPAHYYNAEDPPHMDTDEPWASDSSIMATKNTNTSQSQAKAKVQVPQLDHPPMDAMKNRQHPPEAVVSVVNLEMVDWAGASDEYMNRCHDRRSTAPDDNSLGSYRPPDIA